MNKVTYGLESMHIAFKGTSQTETIEVTAPCTTDGEITVTVTATTLLGADSPKAVIVPLAAETHTTVTKVASTVVNALNNDSVISAVFTTSHSAGVITLKTKVAQANDATLAIAFTVGTTGVTVGASTNGTNGTTSWGTPTAIPGAVRFTPTPQGQEVKFYADNGLYFTATSNDGYTAELEAALIPDSILAEMLGWRIDTNGMLVEVADGVQKEFALMGQVEGDSKNRRFVYYQCKAARPAKEHSTKGEAIEVKTDVLTLTITPITINGEKVVKGTMELNDTNTAAYNAFFNAVTVPQAA
ncbi:MAG: major tail protein [Bacillota bacterium]